VVVFAVEAAGVVLVVLRVLATDFFFLRVEVVEVCGEAAHAPMARAADKATERGTRVSRKNLV
jgi:hypothetical protein